jgi:hypothetical protein
MHVLHSMVYLWPFEKNYNYLFSFKLAHAISSIANLSQMSFILKPHFPLSQSLKKKML